MRANGGSIRAVVCRAWAPYTDLPLERVPRPPMRAGGVRIATRAAGVSFATTLITAGEHQTKPPFPFIPGTEVAGVVTEIAPGVSRVRVGDRVCAAPEWGGHAEEVVALEHDVFRIPEGLPFAEAAQFPLSYGTAYAALVWRARLRAGETLLVSGASGAVGLAAVEVGHALGARVIACVGSPEKCQVVRDHGAEHVFAGYGDNLVGRIKAVCESVDVAFDPVGGPAFEAALRSAGPLARIVVIGFAAGQRQTIPANLLLVKNVDVIGLYFGRYLWDGVQPRLVRDAQLLAAFAQLFDWTSQGRLRPTASLRFPLDNYRDAMQAVIDRKGIGKVVLEMP